MKALFSVVVSLCWVGCGPCGCLLNPVVCEQLPVADGGQTSGDGGVDGGMQASGSGTLDGGAGFTVGHAMFTGPRLSDGGLAAFTMTLAEERAICIQGMIVSLGFDAGSGRVIQIDLESLDGTALREGTYRWPSTDAGALLSVSRFTTPRGVVMPADTAQLELSTGTPDHVRGHLNASFENGDATVSGAFDAIRCDNE